MLLSLMQSLASATMMLLLPLLLLLTTCVLRCDCDSVQTPPIVGIEMSDAGYHRDLLYTVQFDYPLAGREECEYLLEQPLPAAVYVSVDQLNDLQRLQKLTALYPKFVDIEVPTEKGNAFTVLLRGMPKITDSIKLPIHFRYHSARDDDSTFVQVQLTTPNMYMRCTTNTNSNSHSNDNNNNNNDMLLDNDLLASTADTRYCLHTDSDEPGLELYDASSDGADDAAAAAAQGDCNWQQVRVDYQLKSPLHAEIPVGNTKAFPPVLIATIIASWGVSLWTVYRTNSVPRRINSKLEEQRILQRKIK